MTLHDSVEITTPLIDSSLNQPFSRLSDGSKCLIRLLGVLLLERLSFFAIIGNFSSYVRYYLDFPGSYSNGMLFVVWGSVYALAPIFGVITDRKTGHFTTLVSAFIAYIVGSALILYSSSTSVVDGNMNQFDNSLKKIRLIYLVGLALAMISVSAIRSSLMPYMLEQLGDGHGKRNLLMAFCSWAYLIVNIAMAIAVGLGAYLHRLASTDNAREHHTSGFFWIYLLPPCALFLALCILFYWRNSFKSQLPIRGKSDYEYGPKLTNILKTACGCFHDPSRPSYYDPDALPVRNEEDRQQYKRRIERLKLAVLVPVLGTLMAFFMIYSQMHNSFAEQALHLELRVSHLHEYLHSNNTNTTCSQLSNHLGFILTPSLVQLFDCATVLAVVPLTWLAVRPCYEKLFAKELTVLVRMQLGILFGVLANLSATILERLRTNYKPFHYNCLKVGREPYVFIHANISFLWQTPQYILLGISTAFTTIASMEFVLSRAPHRFRCTAVGLLWLTEGMGYYLGLLIYYSMSMLGYYYNIIHPTSGADLNTNNINKLIQEAENSKAWIYYLVLTILMFLTLLAFMWVKYRHKDVQTVERPGGESTLNNVVRYTSL